MLESRAPREIPHCHGANICSLLMISIQSSPALLISLCEVCLPPLRLTHPTTKMSPPKKLSKSRSRVSASDSLTTMMESLTTQKRQLARDDEADVVLQFEDSYIIVSARIMSESSPVFREWLDSTSSDPDTRSPTNPQWLEMSSDVSAAHMKFLCALLHGHRLRSDYPGRDEPAVLSLLGGLAIMAKKAAWSTTSATLSRQTSYSHSRSASLGLSKTKSSEASTAMRVWPRLRTCWS